MSAYFLDSTLTRQYRIARLRDIFVAKYEAILPYYATVSEEDVKRFGSPTTGIKSIDRQMLTHDCIRYMTISEMVDVFMEGTTIRIKHYKDSEKIYVAARDYIHMYRDILQDGNTGRAFPLEDLIHLDQFVKRVYSKARNIMNPDIYQGQGGNRFLADFRRAGFGFRTNKALRDLFVVDETTGAQEVVKDVNEYASMETIFTQRLRSLNGVQGKRPAG